MLSRSRPWIFRCAQNDEQGLKPLSSLWEDLPCERVGPDTRTCHKNDSHLARPFHWWKRHCRILTSKSNLLFGCKPPRLPHPRLTAVRLGLFPPDFLIRGGGPGLKELCF